ncbi:hypothetical protein [Rhodococcus aetherivorans]
MATTAAAAFFAMSVPPKAQAFYGDDHALIVRAALPLVQSSPDDGVDATALNQIIGSLLDGTGTRGADLFQFDAFRHIDSAASPAEICVLVAEAWDFYIPQVIRGAAPAGPPDFRLLSNGPQARSAFGGLAHALADFYSHSNWIELAIAANLRPGLAPIFPTCDDGFLAGVHTGYFNPMSGVDGCPSTALGGEPDPPERFEECHLTLNKDTAHSLRGDAPVPGMSPMTHYDLARALATRHTTELYWLVRSIVARSFSSEDLDGECVARNLFQADRFEPCAVHNDRIRGAVGERCSTTLVGVDVNTGEYIVCVYSREYRPDGVWVTGNIVGVHNIGEPCDPKIDKASQTPDYIPILCVVDQGWQPGP